MSQLPYTNIWLFSNIRMDIQMQRLTGFFLGHIVSHLQDCQFRKLTIVAEEELAVCKAMSHGFYGALEE